MMRNTADGGAVKGMEGGYMWSGRRWQGHSGTGDEEVFCVLQEDGRLEEWAS